MKTARKTPPREIQMTPVPLFSTADNPAPEGALVVPLKAADGVELRAARFPATSGVPFKGTICLFQGRAEYIEKYYELIRELNRRGFDVAALDWRGQGGSQRSGRNRRRGHIRRFADFQRDLDVFMEDFVRPDCRPPHFALAHSMAGAIVLEAARRRTTWWDRIVLAAPMIALCGLPDLGIVRRLAALASALGCGSLCVPGGTNNSSYSRPFAGNPLTGDEARFHRIAALEKAAPHLPLGAPSLGWLRAAHGATDMFRDPEKIAQMRTPTLFIAAGEDSIVSNRAMAALAAQMRTASVVTLPAARHELMMEREPVRQAFLAALEAFVPGSPTFPD
ncbi:alpha/beta fold hydrolase [Terrihabitans sp. B22-R8]|uniref:alpha/beta fold hydrolase n=1 Tax=Terrihabitans sp. B22-R8 TaxID=3425128 RepID=UPI00403C2F0F